MTKNINGELKVRGKFLINIESRSEEKRIKFTKWINAQNNPQSSFLSLIEHCIDRFGYADVMEHEVAKKLHTELLYFGEQDYTQLNIKNLEREDTSSTRNSQVENINTNQDNTKSNSSSFEEENILKADLNSF